MWPALLLSGCLALVSAGSLSAASQSGTKEAADAAAGAVKSLDLQTDLPRERSEPGGWQFRLPAELFWIVLVAGVGALIYAFWDELPMWHLGRRRDWSHGAEESGVGGTSTPEAVAAAADDLARKGLFGEAMHALLLQSLADVRQRLDEQFADSLTSREILRSTKLPAQGREPLREIIARVERTYFGEYAAGPQDYMACRERFSELERALQGVAAA